MQTYVSLGVSNPTSPRWYQLKARKTEAPVRWGEASPSNICCAMGTAQVADYAESATLWRPTMHGLENIFGPETVDLPGKFRVCAVCHLITQSPLRTRASSIFGATLWVLVGISEHYVARVKTHLNDMLRWTFTKFSSSYLEIPWFWFVSHWS